MKHKIQWPVIRLVIGLSAIALSSCATVEVDPNATPVAVVDANGQVVPAVDATRAATIANFQTESAQSFSTPGPTTIASTNPLAVTVVVAVSAECRYGPGPSYGVVISLFAGESAVILGVEPGGAWYYVETFSSVRCWILGSLLTLPQAGTQVAGPPPVISPPPPPVNTLTPTPFPTLQDIGTPFP